MYFFADGLVKRLEELEKTAELYKGEVTTHCQVSLKALCSDTDCSCSDMLMKFTWFNKIVTPAFACRFNGAHEATAPSFLWALADTQRWVCHVVNLTALPRGVIRLLLPFSWFGVWCKSYSETIIPTFRKDQRYFRASSLSIVLTAVRGIFFLNAVFVASAG